MTKNDGGSAFCMSLRDWFAGQALAGMLAWKAGESTVEAFAQVAYEHADAMLAEREKGSE